MWLSVAGSEERYNDLERASQVSDDDFEDLLPPHPRSRARSASAASSNTDDELDQKPEPTGKPKHGMTADLQAQFASRTYNTTSGFCVIFTSAYSHISHTHMHYCSTHSHTGRRRCASTGRQLW